MHISRVLPQSPRLKRLCASDDIQSFILCVYLLNGLGPNVIVSLGVVFHKVAHFQETTYLFPNTAADSEIEVTVWKTRIGMGLTQHQEIGNDITPLVLRRGTRAQTG